ncbi:MAG: energy transducer TonB [Bacteroidetes bacterium]|nr:energy transducer TonB [Bacteroidota bacterium]
MVRLTLLVVVLGLSSRAFAQSGARDKPSPPPTSRPFEVVDQIPELIGGLEGLQDRLEYPASCLSAGTEGRVFVQFVVDKEGHPSEVRVVRGLHDACDEAAVQVVEQSHFIPGLDEGKTVRVRMSLPVTFQLD